MEKYKILVVEDDKDVRESILDALDHFGYAGKGAQDGEDGFAKLKEERPDIIFTDYNMPVMNGVEFAKKVKTSAEYSNVPIILFSTESLDSQVFDKYRTYFDGSIEKPLRIKKVRKTIDDILRDSAQKNTKD